MLLLLLMMMMMMMMFFSRQRRRGRGDFLLSENILPNIRHLGLEVPPFRGAVEIFNT